MNNLPKGQSYLCGQANEPLLYETIGACVERIAATYPDKEALVVRHQNLGHHPRRRYTDPHCPVPPRLPLRCPQ